LSGSTTYADQAVATAFLLAGDPEPTEAIASRAVARICVLANHAAHVGSTLFPQLMRLRSLIAGTGGR